MSSACGSCLATAPALQLGAPLAAFLMSDRVCVSLHLCLQESDGDGKEKYLEGGFILTLAYFVSDGRSYGLM